jgi:UDP-N-acetylmuramoyl-L-alanyl-D-glutamate--2,6-diaminopimelate ligase
MLISDVDIKGVTADSRQVEEGFLFAALPGSKVNGCDYILPAIEKGAALILMPRSVSMTDEVNVPIIYSDNPHQDFAKICADFYKEQPAHIVAVTGTNGKTSTAYFAQQIWDALGYPAASLGTLGVCSLKFVREGGMTTPDPVHLHEMLGEMSRAGIDYLAMEASSHGLDQYRLDGVKIAAAAFTNLTQDHLDYHVDMESYFQAKARLFSELLVSDGTAILNADSDYFLSLKEICEERDIKVIDYGFDAHKYQIVEVKPVANGIQLKLNINTRPYDFILPLVGLFQVKNVLAALGLVLSTTNVEDATAISVLERIKGTPGRLQFVEGHPKGAGAYVDYAHTPDAIDNVLSSLRPHTEGRLICIFGCGGDRDRSKRPLMGKYAVAGADIAILADDNPRSEDPACIRADVLAGVSEGSILEIGDRRKAIYTALEMAEKGDIVAVTGKGHETGQIIGSEVFPFNDVDEVKKAIDKMALSSA